MLTFTLKDAGLYVVKNIEISMFSHFVYLQMRVINLFINNTLSIY